MATKVIPCPSLPTNMDAPTCLDADGLLPLVSANALTRSRHSTLEAQLVTLSEKRAAEEEPTDCVEVTAFLSDWNATFGLLRKSLWRRDLYGRTSYEHDSDFCLPCAEEDPCRAATRYIDSDTGCITLESLQRSFNARISDSTANPFGYSCIKRSLQRL